MKKILLSAAVLLMLAACGGNNQKTDNNNNENMNAQKEQIKDVAGRKNFGSAHALVTTPQPCVMIATFSFSYIFGSKTNEKAAGKFLSWSLSAAIV